MTMMMMMLMMVMVMVMASWHIPMIMSYGDIFDDDYNICDDDSNWGVVVRSTVIDDVHGNYNDNRMMKMNTMTPNVMMTT